MNRMTRTMTEELITSIILQKPTLMMLITISKKWFRHPMFVKMIDAAKDDPDGDAVDQFIIAYNKYGFRGDSDLFNKIGNTAPAPTLTWLKFYVTRLRKMYFNERLEKLMYRYQQAPATSTINDIVDCGNEIRSIGVGKDINHTDKAADGLLHDLDHSKPTGIKTYKHLDYILNGGFYGSCLFTIGATTGTGKTSYAINLAYEAILNNPSVEIDYFTEEMTSREILDRFISRMTGISQYVLRDPHDRVKSKAARECIAQAAKVIKESNLKIYDTTHTLDDIASVIRSNASQRKENTYMAIVDYIGLVDVGDDKIQRYLQIGKITRALKMLTSDFNIPIIEITQLNRHVDLRDDPEPQLSDIRESGSVEQDSNVVLFLYDKPKTDDIVVAKIAKNRDGKQARIYYRFRKSEMTFTEIPKHKGKGGDDDERISSKPF